MSRRRYFNITGPCFPHMHYMLPPSRRLVGAQLDRYVGDQLYWVLHAPRQTGKTTFLLNWARELSQGGEVAACYVTVERCQGVLETGRAIPAIVTAIRSRAEAEGLPIPELPDCDPESQLEVIMKDWAAKCAPKPLVVLFDEVDVLEGPAMISFLRQLRGGFATRGIGQFPVSVALVGMRDLKDYLVNSKDGQAINPGSPFNIKHSSATLGCFSLEDIQELYGQFTADTGTAFAAGVAEKVFEWSCGQPWLVNALAEHMAHVEPPAPGQSITLDLLERARVALIKSRAVHIDNLAERLRQPRVRRVIEPIVTGNSEVILREDDPDVLYCLDLGLIAFEKGYTIANPIYREVLIRSLSLGYQQSMPEPEFRWQTPEGQLDIQALMQEFQRFWRRHSEIWESKADYTEAFPHLLLMGFLQRVINGGGRIEREVAAGRGRLDLMVEFAGEIHAIEIKLVHPADGWATTLEQGLQQLARYADRLQATTRTLVIFDRRPEAREKSWEERLSLEQIGEVLVLRA
jgi:hypothetical protein